ncbi:MAG: hypothetical protein ACUVT8_09475 [Armatimonadota bacterium]
MVRKISLVFLAVVVATVVTGCGGGGGGTGGGDAVTPGVTLLVGADTVYGGSVPEARLMQAGPIHLKAPVEDGAQVLVYNFETGELIKTGTITNGWCRLENVPSGLSLAVVVKGKRGEKNYRLSTLIPVVTGEKEYVADPVTSVVAEAFSTQNFAKNTVFSDDDLKDVEVMARQWVQAHSGFDFSIDGGVFTSTDFGKEGSLNPNAPDINRVIEAVRPVNDKIARAKNTITLAEEAGTPFWKMVGLESLDLQEVFTDQVISKYNTLYKNMGNLLVPAIATELRLNGQKMNVSGLEVGRKYTVTGIEPYDSYLILRDDGAGTSGYITIRREVPGDGIYTLVAKHEGSSWILTQTCTGDAQMQYKFIISDKILQLEEFGENPTISGTLTARDKNLATPVTLQLSASATGADPDHYTAFTITGNISTPEVTMSGSFGGTFASSLPEGAAEWQSRYDFPTSVSMTNARVTVKVGSKQITLQGNLSGKTQFVRLSDRVVAAPNVLRFSGGYSNTSTGLTFTGSITSDITWVAKNNEAEPSTGTITVSGSLKKPDHPTYSIDVKANKTATQMSVNLSLTAATISFDGTGIVKFDQTSGDPKSASMRLEASTGAVIYYSKSETGAESGRIEVDGTKVADITFSENVIRINFTDGTFKAFPFRF